MRIRRLEAADVVTCIVLGESRGWRSDAAKWHTLLAVGEGFGVEVAGELAGTVIVTRFGARTAVIAMMLVSPAHARRGLGRQLLEHALSRAGEATAFLYASESGRPLYERFGFAEIATSARLEGVAGQVDSTSCQSIAPEDVDDLCALDGQANGVARRKLLEVMIKSADRTCVVRRGDRVVGFGLSGLTADVRLVGPIVADDDLAAHEVASALVKRGERVRVDLQPGEIALLDWGSSHGLRASGSVPLMVRGDRPLPGRRELNRALAGRYFG